MELSQILAALDSINPLLETIRLKESESEWMIKAEQLAVIARHALELNAVAAEVDGVSFQKQPKEFRFLQAIERNLEFLSMEFRDLVTDSIYLKDIDMLELLMEDERFEQTDEDFAAFRFLYPALSNGYLDISKLLLNYEKKDILTKLNRECNILWTMFGVGLVDIFELLLQDGRVTPNFSLLKTLVDDRTISSPELFVKLLLKDGRVNPATNENYALMKAVESRNIYLIRALLEDPRVDPAANRNEPLVIAVNEGDANIAIVSLLLKTGRVILGPTSFYIDPLEFAMKKKATRLVEILAEAYANKERMDSQRSH